MEIIINKIDHDLDIKKYVANKNSCFLDIETTGLSRYKNIIYLIGVLYYDLSLKSWVLKQYFANTMEKEIDLLSIFIRDISNFDTIITYNGDNFDIPFINHRLKHNNINDFVNKDKSFDLYALIRKNRQYLNLKNLKLKTIEESLGFFREDEHSGFDCIGFYYEYVKTNNLDLKKFILKHNYDDLVHMLDVIQILDVIDNKKSFYLDSDKNNDDKNNRKKKKYTIVNIEFSKDILEVSLNTNTPFKKNIKYFSNSYNITSKNLMHLNISIDIKYAYISKNEICTYVDRVDYPYIDASDCKKYNIPSNIFILTVEKEYYIENIKELLKSILKELASEKII